MKSKKTIALLLVISGIFLFNPIAKAAIPTLTVSGNNGGSALITVYGDQNASVVLYYTSGSYSGLQTQNIGTTNSSGYFSANINTSSYGITPGYSVYVMVNGQQSSSVIWPYSGSNNGQISLSQTSLTLRRGQSANISVYGTSNAIAYNPNSDVLALSVSGNQLTVTGNNPGSVNVSVCDQGYQSNCITLYVTVQDGSSQNISFSQNNITVYSGQSVNVSIYGGGNNYYYISTNSNPSAVTANISGSIITLTANSNSGNATISVCSQNYGCGSLFVTSNGGYGLGLILPNNFQITNNVLNKTLSQYSYVNSVEAQEGDVVEFEIRIRTNNYQQYNYNSSALVVNLNDNLPYGLTYISGSTKVNESQVVDGITSSGIYLNNFYAGQEQVVKFSAMVNSNLYSGTLTNQLSASMNGSTQTASSNVVIRSRGTVLGAADIVTGPEGAMPLAMFLGIITALPIYYFFSYKKFRRSV